MLKTALSYSVTCMFHSEYTSTGDAGWCIFCHTLQVKPVLLYENTEFCVMYCKHCDIGYIMGKQSTLERKNGFSANFHLQMEHRQLVRELVDEYKIMNLVQYSQDLRFNTYVNFSQMRFKERIKKMKFRKWGRFKFEG